MIEYAFIVALAVLFLHVTTWEGMIFERIGMVLHRLPEWIKKPLYDCPICMAPWWGSLLLWGLGFKGEPLQWMSILFAAGGINAVLIYIISYAKDNDD